MRNLCAATREQPLRAETRESPCTATKTQCNHRSILKKLKRIGLWWTPAFLKESKMLVYVKQRVPTGPVPSKKHQCCVSWWASLVDSISQVLSELAAGALSTSWLALPGENSQTLMPGFPWTSLRVLFSSADFALRPFTVINLSHKYD